MASLQSESGVHASQVAVPPPSVPAAGEGTSQEEAQEAQQQARKTKRQLWDDLTISCKLRTWLRLYFGSFVTGTTANLPLSLQP